MSDNSVRIVIETDAARAETVLKHIQGTIRATGKAAVSAGSDFAKGAREANKAVKEAGNDFLAEARDWGLAIQSWSNIAQMAVNKVKQAYRFSKEIAEVGEARAVFDAYAASVGESSSAILDASRKASGGQVEDMELVRETMTAMRSGVTHDAAEIAKLWQISEAKSDQYGGTIVENFQKITDAITRGNGKTLLSLGLLPDSMGRASNAADLLSKRGKLLSSVLTQFGDDADMAARTGDSAADSFNRFEASIGNLKTAATGLLPAVTVVVDVLTRLVGVTSDFIALSHKLPSAFAAAMNPVENDFLNVPARQGMNQAQTRDYLKGVKQYNLDMIGRGTLTDATQEKLLRQNELIGQLLKTKSLEEEMGRATEQRAKKAAALITAVTAGHEKAGKKVADHRAEVDRLGLALENVTRQLVEGWGVKGVRSIEDAEKILLAATSAAGGFAQSLKDGVTDAGLLAKKLEEVSLAVTSGFAGKIAGGEALATLTPEKASQGMADFMGVGWMLRGEGKKPSPAEVETRAREVIETPLSRVFNDALVEGLEGGNFFQALGRGMKKVVLESLANSITGAIFGQSGAISGIIGGGGSAAGGGGGGILNGLLKPMFHSKGAGGGINWGGLGTNLLVGGALSWLTSPGRLFGGTVTHGGEVPGQAADVNSQVAAAQGSRDQILSTAIGLSRETAAMLRDLRFYTAGYSVNSSGDGIFSKKTKTYELDANAAYSSMAKFEEIAQRAALEEAQRNFEIGMAALTSQSRATEMTIDDLRNYLDRRTGSPTGEGSSDPNVFPYRLQLAQLTKQLEETVQAQILARAGRAFDYLVSTPGSGSSKELLDIAKARAGYSSTGQFQLDSGDWVDAENYGQLREFGLMIPGMKTSAAEQYRQQSAEFNAANNPEGYRQALEDRGREIGDQLKVLEDLMADAERQAQSATLNLQQRQQAFQDFQKAMQAYYSSKMEALQIEQQQEALTKQEAEKAKAAADSRITDIMGTMLTHIGEVSERGGQKIIVLAAGQPDARDLAIQIRDLSGGSNPELEKALTQFVESKFGPRF